MLRWPKPLNRTRRQSPALEKHEEPTVGSVGRCARQIPLNSVPLLRDCLRLIVHENSDMDPRPDGSNRTSQNVPCGPCTVPMSVELRNVRLLAYNRLRVLICLLPAFCFLGAAWHQSVSRGRARTAPVWCEFAKLSRLCRDAERASGVVWTGLVRPAGTSCTERERGEGKQQQQMTMVLRTFRHKHTHSHTRRALEKEAGSSFVWLWRREKQG